MLAPIWRPAGNRTNVSGRQSRKYQTQKIHIFSQVAIVSTERQFDSHYLEEHLDLDLKEQQRKGAGNKTNGYAKMPTHEQADHCRCLISTPKQQNNYSSFSRCGEKDILKTSLESAGSAGDQTTICDNSLSRWERKAPFKSTFQIASASLKFKFFLRASYQSGNVGWDWAAVKCLECSLNGLITLITGSGINGLWLQQINCRHSIYP